MCAEAEPVLAASDPHFSHVAMDSVGSDLFIGAHSSGYQTRLQLIFAKADFHLRTPLVIG